MASVDLEYNQGFKIYNANGTRFNNLVLHKATYETVVMSLGDKISGIVYYKNNKLVVNMTEYIMYKNVKYVLVNPPTVIKEGLVSDNGELKGMTKYSFTFYHPMYMLSNFPFSDVAVNDSQKQYLSQNKTFSWIGNLVDYKDKLNKNLEGTQWKVSIGTNVTDTEKNKLSEVLSFDNNTIADALKTAYETWEIPYIVDKVEAGTQDYLNGKLFVVQFGLPSNEIYKKDKNGNFILDDNNQKIPFVFKYGQGVGLKNNSRTPKNNKIVTRIAGYGSEDNIPYGYPQIVWTGESSWNYTINNASGMQTITVGGRTIQAMSYPIYDGIVGGQKVRLIKHPFTRTHLMPPIYSETVNNKVNPNATGYNPNIELVDYYDANDNTYPNQIKAGEQSYEIHEFEDIKPEFDSSDIHSGIYSATPYDGHSDESISQDKFLSIIDAIYTETDINAEKAQLNALRTGFVRNTTKSGKGTSGNYEYDWWWKEDVLSYKKVKYASSGANFEYVVNVGLTPATIDWDDTMDEQGNYVQSYFKVTIPSLGFDLYASAAITQEMTINMRSGACIGCSFPVMVDWDDYKRNFYDKDGNFAPTGTQRNLTKYPNSTNASITLILQKETNTFGTLMPNIYQKPASGDKFVILGISLPTSYITTAEGKLETEMKKYMRDNNVYYYEYPLKFDEHFLISNEHILSQMKPNVIVNFEYADVEQSLYIKQMSIKYNESPLPKYDITLTDDVDVVLNKIGEAIAEYRGQRQYENGGGSSETLDGNKFLRKDINDTASGTIRMLKGLQVGERFVTGLLGEGGIFRKDDDGTTYLECDRMYVRMKAYFDTVEVRRFLHSGGNRIASAAGIKCSRVEYIASNGLATQNVSKAVKFRCYFRAQDNGVSITNDFVAGDQAYCKETNANLGQHGYWRLVIAKSSNPINGEHWIDLSASDCLSGSDIPIAQDDIIQLGNRTDKTRQGAIVEYVSGEDAPSYQIYQGINTYSLDNKNYIGLGYSSETNRAYMNVYGDMFVGAKPDAITGKSPTYIKYVQDDGTEQHNPKLTIKGIVEMLSPDDPEETTTLDDFAKAITGDIEYLQQQIDGEIDTWFYDGVPTLNNYPAIDWTTDNLKKEHLGDLYYDKLNGNAYRFIYDKDSETYSWLLLSDSAILEALRIANEAKDTADNKRRVFLTDAQHPHPTPPYDEGDLWVNAVWPSSGEHQGETYNDEILKCIKPVPREEGGSDVTEFSIGDWSAANGYKTALSDFINNTYTSFVTNIQTQVDRKAQTWYLSFDPSYSWAGNEKQHVGDLWYCTDDIENTDYKKNTTWIYQETINPETGITTYYWAKASVPDEVFDKIDRKAAIYVEWNAWLDYDEETERVIANNLQVRDLLIPAQDIQVNGVVYKQNKVYRCTNRNTQNPVFEEISYTDNSAFNGYINAILNGTGSSGDAATVAAAQKAIKDALGGGTTVDGGLLLTSLIAMRKYKGSGSTTDIANYTTWAGISGLRKDTETGSGWKGYGIAAWYGGAMVDHEVSTTATDYAKSLFRFDGSGYLAGGNIRWTSDGKVYLSNLYTGNNNPISNLFFDAFAIGLDGTVSYINPQFTFNRMEIVRRTGVGDTITNSSVLNYGEMKARFVPLDFFNALFSAFSVANPTSSSTPIDPSTWTASTVINNLKIKVGTWTEQYLSALGNNPNASGGGGISDLSAVLNELNSKDDLSTGVLVRNGLNNWSWMPYNTGTSGIDVNAMWVALGGTSSNQKIDNSHLSLKSLTFKAGASDTSGVAYSPTDDADKTITFDAAANSGISVTKDNNGTFTIGYTMPDVTLGQITDTDTTYTRFVVDAKGRIVKADKPTTLAKYGITDAVGSATKWWGQSIQTVNNEKVVKGNMTDVGTISASDDITITKTGNNIAVKLIGDSYGFGLHLGSGGTNRGIYDFTSGINKWLLYFNASNTILNYGNVGIGTSEPACKLHVSGTGCVTGGLIVGAYTQQNHMLYVAGSGLIKNNLTISNPDNTTTGAFIKIGGLFLVYDQANNAIKVSGSSNLSENTTANLYATGAVSALGSQSSGGQDTFNADLMWQELSGSPSNKVISNTHLSLGSLTIQSGNNSQTWTPTSGSATITVNSGLDTTAGDARYLKLDGSNTMTGVLNVKAGQYNDGYSGGALNMNNSNIFNVNGIFTSDAANSPSEGYNFYRDASHVDSFWIYNGEIHFTPNRELGTDGTSYTVLHTNNVPKYAAGLSVYAGTEITSGGSFDNVLNAGTYYVQNGTIYDSLGGSKPSTDGNQRLWHIVNTGTDGDLTYQWSTQVLLSPNSARWFTRSHDQNSFGAWKEFAFTDSTVSKAKQLDDTVTRKFWGQTYWQNGKPVSSDVTGALSGSGDITITKTANNIAVKLVGGSYQFGLHLGGGGTNRGLFDFTSGINNWLLYFNASNTILNYGNVGIGTDSPSGKLHVLGNAPDGNSPICRIVDNGTFREARMIWALRPNMTAGQLGEISVGKAQGRYNLGQLAYKHVADSSANNFISLGIYGIGAGLAVYGNSTVYIGGAPDTAPTHRLYVNGSTYTTLVDFGNGITLQKVTENGVTSLKCTGNFYATGAVSALGSNTGGSGGGVVDLHKPLSSIYEQIQEDPTSNNSILVYSGGRWGYSVLNLSSYLTSSSIKSLTIQGNGTSAVTFNPAGATSPTLNIKGGDGVTVTASSNTITINGSGNFKSLTFKAGSSDVLSYTPSDAKTLTFAKDGDLSINSANNTITYSYTLPTATSSAKGGVKIGGNLSMNGEVLSVGSNVALLGTAQTFTANHKFNDQCWTLQGVETNGKDIIRNIQSNFNETKLYETNGSTLAYDTAITNAIEFMWYDHYWRIGNVRKDTDTYGFSIAHKEGNGNLYDVFRITKDGGFQSMGSSYNAGSLKVSGHVAINNPIEDDYNLYVDGNVRATQVSWFPSLELSDTTPYIDFHVGKSTADYTPRIIARSETVSDNTVYYLSLVSKNGANTTEQWTGLRVGEGYANSYIQIGGAKLIWDGSALKCDKDFYSTGAVSALGSNTSSGGGGISDISVSASLSGTRLTINVSGQTGSVDLSSISGTSGDYIPLSGSDAITGDLKPASGYDELDLGNSANKWRQIHGKEFVGETVSLLENKIELNFRATQHDNFGCKVGYRTYGDEALVFANKNASTSFIFYTGSELITDENNTYSGGSYGTPALQIKENSVYINRPIINGVSPSYELYVNGRSYADEVWIGNYQDNRDVYLKRYNTQGGGILDIMAPQGARLNATTTVTSDMRLKNIVSFVDNLTVEGVAMAPIFNFKWKDRPKGFTSVGTSAQYWQSTLPNVVIDLDNILSLDYGATALASAVITARKVVNHELRIKQLEQENEILRKKIEELKAA